MPNFSTHVVHVHTPRDLLLLHSRL